MKKWISLMLVVVITLTLCPQAFALEDTKKVMAYGYAKEEFANEVISQNAEKTDIEKLEESLLEIWEENIEESAILDVDLTVSEFVDYYFFIKKQHPEYFNISTLVSYGWDNLGYVRYVFVHYIETKPDKLAIMQKNFDTATNEAGEIFDSDMSDIEKALVLHEYLVTTAEYDYENFATETIPEESYSAYGVLVNKIGVCQSYAFAYKYILEKFTDISVVCCESHDMNHIWNRVEIEGKYYQLDCTWDDTKYGEDTIGLSNHELFIKSDNYFKKSGYYSFEAEPQSNTTLYDNVFWNKIGSKMCYSNGYWYYISSSGYLTKYSFDTKKEVKIVNASSSFLNGGGLQHGKLDLYDGTIFYSTANKIYSIGTDGSNKTEIFSESVNNKDIYGLTITDGELRYSLKGSIYDIDDIKVAFVLSEGDWAPSAKNLSSGGIGVSFNALYGAKSYNIYRKTAGGTFKKIKNTTALSYTDTSVAVGKKYYYAVTAIMKSGEETVIDEKNICSKLATPAMPKLTSATSTGYKSISVKWQPATNAEGYFVYRRTAGGQWQCVKTTSALSFTDTAVTTGKKYYYCVAAYCTYNGKKYRGVRAITGLSATPVPSTPTIKLSSSSKKAYTSWTSIKGASGYEVYRATSKNGSYSLRKRTTGLKYTNYPLTKGKRYYYKVRAYRIVSGKRVYGKFSPVKSIVIR